MMTRFRVRLGSPVVRLAVLCFCLQLMHTIQPSLDLSPAHSSGSLRRRPALHWLHWHHCFRPTINKDQRRKQRSDAWLFWASKTGLGAWNWENASAHLLYLVSQMKEISLKADQRYSASVKICQNVKTMKKDYKYCQDDTCFVWTSRLQNSSAMCPSDIKWSWVTASQYLTQRQSAPGQRRFNSQVRITCSDSRLHKRISAGLFHANCVRKTMANVTPAPKACTEQGKRFDRMTCFPRFFHLFCSRSPFPSLFWLEKTREHHIVVQKTDAGCTTHLEGIMMMNPRCIFPVSACAWLPHVMLPPVPACPSKGSVSPKKGSCICVSWSKSLLPSWTLPKLKRNK